MSNRAPVALERTTGQHLRPHGWSLALILMGLTFTLSLSALDATIVGTALPRIVGDLHGFGDYSWVVTAYLLTSTTIVPIIGKLSDQFGRKSFLLVGIAFFLLGSALAGTSQTMLQLILFRGLQGAGAGCMQTLVLTLVADLFPAAERGRWQGIFVGVGVAATIVGPAIGGWITDHADWRWVFYINLPIGLLALLVLILQLPSTVSIRSASSQDKPIWRRIDFSGALTAAAATTCLLLGLTWGGSAYPWNSAPVAGILIAAGVLYLAFLINERLVEEPLLPLDLFHNQVFAASGALALALGMLIYAMIFYLPLFIQGALGQTASSSGASLIPFFIPIGISAILGGQMIAKVGRYQFLAVIGAIILLTGTCLLAGMNTDTTLNTITWNMIVVGLGTGMLQPIYTLAGQNAISPQRLGTGTGAITYLRAMGSLIGTAILGAVVTNSATVGRSTNLSIVARQALAASVEHAFLITCGVAAGILIATLFLKDVRLRKRGEAA